MLNGKALGTHKSKKVKIPMTLKPSIHSHTEQFSMVPTTEKIPSCFFYMVEQIFSKTGVLKLFDLRTMSHL